jgi:hypothetical protein
VETESVKNSRRNTHCFVALGGSHGSDGAGEVVYGIGGGVFQEGEGDGEAEGFWGSAARDTNTLQRAGINSSAVTAKERRELWEVVEGIEGGERMNAEGRGNTFGVEPGGWVKKQRRDH